MNIEIIERTHSILRVILFIVLIGSVVFLIAGIIGYKTWTECFVCVILSFILSSILRWLRIKIWNTYIQDGYVLTEVNMRMSQKASDILKSIGYKVGLFFMISLVYCVVGAVALLFGIDINIKIGLIIAGVLFIIMSIISY